MEVLLFFFGLELAFALDRESVVFHAHIQVLLFHARNFNLENQLVGILIDIDCRHKIGSR